MVLQNPKGLFMPNEIIHPTPMEQYKIYDPNHTARINREVGILAGEEIVPRRIGVHKKRHKKMQLKKHKTHKKTKTNFTPLAFLSKLSVDDLIIIGIIVLLILESEEEIDIPLLAALGFLFISEFIQK